MKFISEQMLYRFPSNNSELHKKWIIATKRDNLTPSKSSVLCEKHFKTSDYFCNDIELPSNLCVKWKRLKPDAIQITDKLVREMLVNWHDRFKQRKERVVLEVVKELKK